MASQTYGSSAPFGGIEFTIEQKVVAMRNTFGIKDRNGNLLAYVKKKIVGLGPSFWFDRPAALV